MVSHRFETLGQYSEWNSGEHSNMGQGNLANNWNFIKDRFIDLEMHFIHMRNKFMNSEITFYEIGNLLGNFDGTYGSLSGLPTLFDGNFSSLLEPTTLAGYGIWWRFLKKIVMNGKVLISFNSEVSNFLLGMKFLNPLGSISTDGKKNAIEKINSLVLHEKRGNWVITLKKQKWGLSTVWGSLATNQDSQLWKEQ
ncbi:MAG: hypothetical protein CM15mP83_7790 [Flavobacteriaceae bacterium]|nr:MAG: hypothetical protein CM15mP83_7790 [Flavobacteriaceae bacterium]